MSNVNLGPKVLEATGDCTIHIELILFPYLREHVTHKGSIGCMCMCMCVCVCVREREREIQVVSF